MNEEVSIKSADDIEKMRVAGKLASEVLEMITPFVVAGVSTEKLDQICHDYIVNEQDAIPACLNYHGFPKSVCTSINDVICHGIPNATDILKNGDILNIDVTVIKDGFHGDTSKMFMVGEVNPKDRRLIQVTQESMYEAIKVVRPGIKLGEIGTAIEKYIKSKKSASTRYTIVKDFIGHGIGEVFHEAPEVLHYKNNHSLILKPGMCFTIEPMINAGKPGIRFNDGDSWTAYTVDGKKSAQWEHTILVTEKGCEVLTLRADEKFKRIWDHN